MIERTLLIIKPDAIKRKLLGNIISILESYNDIKILDLKKFIFSIPSAESFYFEHRGKKFYNDLINFITSGDSVALILEGVDIIKRIRVIIGNTNYEKADKDSIRGKFAYSLTENVVHASDSKDSFVREVSIIFKKN